MCGPTTAGIWSDVVDSCGQRLQTVVRTGALALVVARLNFAARLRALVVQAARHRAGIAFAKGSAARIVGIGAGHARDVRSDLFDRGRRQAASVSFGPVERNAEGAAAGSARQARVVVVRAHDEAMLPKREHKIKTGLADQ
jgi:hypothetical protein